MYINVVLPVSNVLFDFTQPTPLKMRKSSPLRMSGVRPRSGADAPSFLEAYLDLIKRIWGERRRGLRYLDY